MKMDGQGDSNLASELLGLCDNRGECCWYFNLISTLVECRNGCLDLAFLNLNFPNNSTEEESLLTQ